MTLQRNVIANYLGQAWATGMGLAFLPLYISYLGIETYGLIGIYALLQAWLGLFEMGLSPALAREMARFTGGAIDGRMIRDLLRTAETLCVAVALLVAGAVWFGADWLASEWLNLDTLAPDEVASSVQIMAAVIGFRFCEGIYRSSLIGLERQVWYNVVNSVLATLRWGGAVAVLHFVSPTIEAFFMWQTFVSALSVVTLAYGTRQVLPPGPARPSMASVRHIWRFAGGMVAISLLSLLLLQVDKLLVSRLLSLSEFALYSLAATVSAALSFIAGPVSQAFYPRFTHYVSSGDEVSLRRAYMTSSQLLAILTVPVATTLAAFSRELLQAWTGNPIVAEGAATILSLFAIGTMFNCLLSMPYMLQLAHGWTSLTVKVNAFALAVLVPAVLFVAPRYGAVGVAAVWLATLATYGQISLLVMYRRMLTSERAGWYLHAWFLPLGAATIVVGLWRLTFTISPDRLIALAELIMIGSTVLVATALATPLGRQSLRRVIGR